MKRSHVVRWIPVVAVMAALALPPSRAVCAEEGSAPDALAPGSWSVQFSVQPNFTLGTYSGSTLSLKKHLGNKSALRLGLSVNTHHFADDGEGAISDTTVYLSQTSAFDGNAWSLGANALYLWYAHNAAPIHAYWGAGPSFSLIHGHDENDQKVLSSPQGGPVVTSTSSNDNKTDGWSVGLGGVLGVEWLASHRIGLFAEYGTSFGYTHAENNSIYTQTDAGSSVPRTLTSGHERDAWDFSGSGGNLGISVYF